MWSARIGYVLSPLQSLITSNQQLQNANIAADRLFQIMDLEREQDESGKMELTKEMIDDITFEDVTFRYGTRKDVFEGLSLKFKKGQTTAIVGESGSGKTTMMSLLQHIYPVNDGCIRIGNYDISQIANNSLREHIGTVPQQIELFQGTVLENIAIGDFNPDIKRVNDLIRMLGLEEFIKGLPQGFNTQIGEHGASLSGGERQRIAIARALYKEPEIIIFDEATSSLDSLSEKYVKEAVTQMAHENKTIIIIAHRLSTVMHADKIVVLENGRLKEEGTHQELMEAKETYYKLWQSQFDYME